MTLFANPAALWLLIIPIALGIFVFKKQKRQIPRPSLLSGPDTILEASTTFLRKRFRLLFSAVLVSLVLIILSLARPFETKSRIEKQSEGIDIAVVLDVSESMDADDFEPSRFHVAKEVVKDFIRRRSHDRISLVIFSGDAVTKAPLTRDYDFLESQVDDIRLREMKQGTAIGMGLTTGIARLRTSESRSKIIVLLTDGDSNVGAINPVTASRLAKQEKIKIYTIGIGKSNRVVVPIYSYDAYGRRTQLIAQVPSYLNPELLQEIAATTGGKAYMARDPGMLSRMLIEIDSLERSKVTIKKIDERIEKFVTPTLAALFILLFVYLALDTRFYRTQTA